MAFVTGLTRRTVCGAAVAALLSLPSNAHAHGGIPRAWGILFEPGNPQHIVVRSDIYGIFQSLDGGKTWTYGCAELYGAKWSQATHAAVVLTPGGRTLVPSLSIDNGKAVGLVMTENLCTWQPSPDIAGKFVQDLTLSGSDLYLVTADGMNGGIIGQVYKSTDKGDHFAAVGKQLPTDFSGSSLMIAPSDPTRVYVLGQLIDTGGLIAIAEVSSDGGTTWTRPVDQTDPSVPQITKDAQGWTPRIYAVHPTRKDVVFAWADGLEGLGVTVADQVWASSDGAKTWKKIYDGQGDLPGFTFSPDATKILVAGPNDGIQEASVDEALANGPSAFTKIFDGQVWGLNWTADGLYAGNNDFTLNRKPTPFTLGVSHDEGKTFSQVMTLCDVSFGTCDESPYGALCSPSWTIPGSTPGLGGYKEDYLEGERCVGPAPKGGDGGTAAPAASSDSGGCEFAPHTSATSAAGASALLALALGRLRRKRR